ncbi:peptide ABC transporter permease [Devosia yakushimensis]|uniref:Peptide ABC transporter permease n=1 Tax=Devosia yakushimensis TaxID=470028 RepID=A0ABQ5U8G2_9HYPH|nr:ABC transporter permease [Devosia yakushimensis]GLQ08086.1 peptide ABC transporter permease [Devosia yakushimensis]
MTVRIILKRLLFLVLVIWAASTIVFFVPRLSPRSAIRERFAELARTGGFSSGDMEKLIASMEQQFGLDKPLLDQYFQYLNNVIHLDFGYSLSKYPATVTQLIAQALPWSIGLLLVTTILSFAIGTVLGAIAAWPRAPGWLRSIATPFILLTGVPPVIMGILLVFFIGFRLKWLPLGGAYSVGTVPTFSWAFSLDLMRHQILPALSLILGSVGGWVLSMRGMGVTIQGEDYVNFAEHKGLTGRRIFRDYYLRNALLPQATALALALGTVVTSAIIVEGLFGLPGVGTLLNLAIRANDFPVIYGVVLFITIAVATLMTVLEFIYPLLDPRIRNQ